jgi:hypothetical protein
MTFTGLILSVLLGYAAGLVIGPRLRREESSWSDICIACGLAGGLAASTPYLLLNSIWVHELVTEQISPDGIVAIVVWLAKHVLVASSACSAIAIITTALLTSNPAERSALAASDSEHSPSLKKNMIWLLLCLPAVALSLWYRLSRQPIIGVEPTYFVGASFVVGLLGYMISAAVTALSQK